MSTSDLQLPAEFTEPAISSRWAAVALWLLLLISAPQFLCMPLTSDTVLFDLQARTVLRGGTLYRDILEPNFPGVVWVHLLIRSWAGWSSVAIRAADLLLVGTAIWLLSSLVRTAAPQPDRRWLLGLACAACYLSRNEWCHCQRDSWLLLPTAAALYCRLQNHRRGQRPHAAWTILEGVCWGGAFWIKPQISLTVACLAVLDGSTNWRFWLRDVLWLLAGGLLAALPGVLWLLLSDTWPHFQDMQLHWNPEYLQAGQQRRTWERIWLMLVRFHPWWLVHVVALPLAVRQIAQSRAATSPAVANQAARAARALAVVYVSWLLQASLLQHAMDYIQVPPLLLALVCLATQRWTLPVVVRRSVLLAFAVLAALTSPQLQPDRLQLWPQCVVSGGTTDLSSRLACGRFPDWQHLQAVVEFLRREQVQQGDVASFDVHCIHIYPQLQLLPPTRYVGAASLRQLFPSRAAEITDTTGNSGQRFLVADLDECPPQPQAFPWNQPVAFASGAFRVYSLANSPPSATAARLSDSSR